MILYYSQQTEVKPKQFWHESHSMVIRLYSLKHVSDDDAKRIKDSDKETQTYHVASL